MIKVLFVCLGNICRSPMAEGLMKKRLKELNLSESIHVESRATSSYEIGQPPHPKTNAILKREGALLTGKTAKRITQIDFEQFDYIIGMDMENVQDLKEKAGTHKDKIYLFRDMGSSIKGLEVPDPYYSGKYEETFNLINTSLDHWIHHLIKSNDSY